VTAPGPPSPTISADEAVHRLAICISSVHRLIGNGVLPAVQVMPSAPWEIPAEAPASVAVLLDLPRRSEPPHPRPSAA